MTYLYYIYRETGRNVPFAQVTWRPSKRWWKGGSDGRFYDKQDAMKVLNKLNKNGGDWQLKEILDR